VGARDGQEQAANNIGWGHVRGDDFGGKFRVRRTERGHEVCDGRANG
jgi:hypothetical protein